MVRMNRVRARIDDMLIIRGVNVFPSEIEKALLQIEDLAPHYQLHLDRQKALDCLEVHVEITESLLSRWGNFNDEHQDAIDLSLKIQAALKDSLGVTAEIKLKKPSAIPRSEGKAQRVFDKRS